MFALKCLRCTNLKVQSHGDVIFRRFPPLSCTRSFVYKPKNRDDHDQKWHPEKQDNKGDYKFEPFYDMVTRRRDEALRSVLITFHQGAEQQVTPFLKSLEGIKNKFFYGLQGMGKKYVLIEFSTIQHANSVLTDANWESGLLFQAEGRVLEMRKTKTQQPKEKISITWHNLEPIKSFLLPEMKTCQTLDEIMEVYLKNVQACDLTTRLHFITCVQIERIFLGAFPKVRVIPFGSSVNGFGRKGSDLDISLLLNHRVTFSRNVSKQNTGPLLVRPTQIDKSPKEMLQLFGSMLQVLLPSCSHVITVPHARVPIIKFTDTDTGSECDLNCSMPLGICMSEILYTLSYWDERCRSLLFTVRAWAKHHGVSNNVSPSTKITNFSLLLLVVFFLQTKNVLPTIREMEQLADDRDLIMYEGEPRLFLRHVSPAKIAQWKKMTGKNNKDTTTKLLADFFSYYSKFPFDTNAITINNGNSVNNPTREPLYVINPLDVTHNVARNVRGVNVDIFKLKCREASNVLSVANWSAPIERWSSLFDLSESSAKRNPKQNIIAALFETKKQEEKPTVKSNKGAKVGEILRS